MRSNHGPMAQQIMLGLSYCAAGMPFKRVVLQRLSLRLGDLSPEAMEKDKWWVFTSFPCELCLAC